MSAFGVVCIGFGILMLWSGIKSEKVNEVLMGFLASPATAGQPKGTKPQPPVQAQTSSYTTVVGSQPQVV